MARSSSPDLAGLSVADERQAFASPAAAPTTGAPFVSLVREQHRGRRAAWLRASVLGADDGIVSLASIMVGVIAAGAARGTVLTAAAAAIVAGAMSMAAGEYVSVSSQRDTERADLAVERRELAANPDAEARELAAIYRSRGLGPDLADSVAVALSRTDALAAHARDELGLDEAMLARPVQAALSSVSVAMKNSPPSATNFSPPA